MRFWGVVVTIQIVCIIALFGIAIYALLKSQ